jgi:hypothetical protein
MGMLRIESHSCSRKKSRISSDCPLLFNIVGFEAELYSANLSTLPKKQNLSWLVDSPIDTKRLTIISYPSNIDQSNWSVK